MHDDLRVAEPDGRPRGIHPYHAPEGCMIRGGRGGGWMYGWAFGKFSRALQK